MAESVKNYFLIILLALFWGSSFILMKKGLEVFDFFQVASLRISIAFFSLIPFLLKAINLVKYKHFFPILIAAFCGTGIPAFLFSRAQEELDSSLVGILNSIVPLFTLILAFCFFRGKLLKTNFFGVIIGFFGVVLLAFRNQHQEIIFNQYVFMVIIATICYAISINVIKNYLNDLEASVIAAISFSVIGPIACFLLIRTDFFYIFQNNQNAYKALGYIIVLALFGTSFASIIFNKLLHRTSAIFVSSVTYLIPIVAILWGLYDGEVITINYVIGFITILSGVYLVSKN